MSNKDLQFHPFPPEPPKPPKTGCGCGKKHPMPPMPPERHLGSPINGFYPIKIERGIYPEKDHMCFMHGIFEQDRTINEVIESLKELSVRFDTNPNYYLKEDYMSLLSVLNGFLKCIQGSLFNAPFEGLLDDLNLDPILHRHKVPGIYIVAKAGKYEKFETNVKKEVFDDPSDPTKCTDIIYLYEPIEVTAEDLASNVVIFKPIIKDDLFFGYEKLLVKEKAGSVGTNSSNIKFRLRTLPNNFITIPQDECGGVADDHSQLQDEILLFQFDGTNKWLSENKENIKIHFYRKHVKGHYGSNKYRKFFGKNSLFTELIDYPNSDYAGTNFSITPVDLTQTWWMSTYNDGTLESMDDLDEEKSTSDYICIPYSTYTLFRRLFKKDTSKLIETYLGKGGKDENGVLYLSGNNKPVRFHAGYGVKTGSISLPFAFRVEYIDPDTKESTFSEFNERTLILKVISNGSSLKVKCSIK